MTDPEQVSALITAVFDQYIKIHETTDYPTNQLGGAALTQYQKERDELLDLFFEMLYQIDKPAIFKNLTMLDMLFEFLQDIFTDERYVDLHKQILNSLYEVGCIASDFAHLERTLVLLTTFINKSSYLELVEDLDHYTTDYRALKIIKNTSLYYLV